MKQFAFIGLGQFSLAALDRLSTSTDEIIVIDTNPVAIEKIKDLARSCYIVQTYDESTLTGLLVVVPDVVIVDIPDNLEATLMVTHSLHKLGVREIIVKSDTDERCEILKIVGATRVVQSDSEAATRIVPLLFSTRLYNYIPLGSNLVMAEVAAPDRYVGMNLVEADLRKRHRVNVIALRGADSDEYRYFDAEYRLHQTDVLLVSGRENDVIAISSLDGIHEDSVRPQRKTGSVETFKKFMKGKR